MCTVVGISRDCCSQIYNGASPLSEPEALAVTDFLSANRDNILCFLTIHSYGQLILLPYGHPNITAPNQDELVRDVVSLLALSLRHLIRLIKCDQSLACYCV